MVRLRQRDPGADNLWKGYRAMPRNAADSGVVRRRGWFEPAEIHGTDTADAPEHACEVCRVVVAHARCDFTNAEISREQQILTYVEVQFIEQPAKAQPAFPEAPRQSPRRRIHQFGRKSLGRDSFGKVRKQEHPEPVCELQLVIQ